MLPLWFLIFQEAHSPFDLESFAAGGWVGQNAVTEKHKLTCLQILVEK